MVESIPGILASRSGLNGEVPGLSRSGVLGLGVLVGDALVDPFVPVPVTSGASFLLAARSWSVLAGTSQGALATAAKRDWSTAGSPANVRGSATSTERLAVPGRSPSKAIESARNRWMVTGPFARDEVCATVLLRGSS
jgi:hypothetical protein